MQVDIGQQGTDDLPLSGPGLRDQEPAVFDDADVNPLPNQAENAAVANPSLDERHELAPHNRIEVALDVGFQHIRNRLATHGAADGVERVVRTESRAIAVSTVTVAFWTILSSRAGIEIGLCFPFSLGM
jgi:hypothetical protein